MSTMSLILDMGILDQSQHIPRNTMGKRDKAKFLPLVEFWYCAVGFEPPEHHVLCSRSQNSNPWVGMVR